MSAFSPTSPPPAGKRPPAIERLLEAAGRIFARDGLAGATTREIARAAGVNEVTLFRHFRTKENLVAAVAERMCGAVSADPFPPQPLTGEAMLWAESFRGVAAILAGFAQVYHALLTKHLPLIRTFIGEIHRHQSHEECVLHSIFQPHREQLAEQLRAARDRGEVRKDVNLELAADQLSGMIFTSVLRRTIFVPKDYTPGDYLAASVRMVASTIEIDSPAEAESGAQRQDGPRRAAMKSIGRERTAFDSP